MSPSLDASVKTNGLVCGYGHTAVLKDVSIVLEPGTITALLGPNGSGKSTLLKTLAKAIPSLGGTATVCGRSVPETPQSELAKLVAFVPQDEIPPFRFTVRQVVEMGRLPHSPGLFDTKEDHDAATRAMRAVDCLQLENRPINEISGGERQRALLARALAQDAAVLLLDEPTSHFDAGHQAAAARLLRDLAGRGHTVFVAVHDLNWASATAGRVILLHEGRVALDADCQLALSSPIIDRAYGVEFERLKTPAGALRVFPRI